MKKITQIIILLSIGLFVTSCYYDAHPAYDDIDDGGTTPPTEVSFSTEIQPLFARCTGCHNGNIQPDLRAGNSYNSLVPQFVKANDADGSRFFNYLPGKGHHDVGFSYNASEIALIKAWINEGAKNN